MLAEWENTTLGNIAAPVYGLVDGPFGSNLPASLYQAQGIPVIRGSNLSLGKEKFKLHEFVFVSNGTANKLARSTCKAGDIIFTKKGTLGQTGLIPKNTRYEKFLLSSNQMKLTVDPAKADSGYVFYCVSSEVSRTKIVQDASITGVPKTNLQYIQSFPISLPPLPEQRAIAHILGTLDDKIELNSKMNETLEAIARALFKSWFVDFDPVRRKQAGQATGLPPEIDALFPAEFEDSALGEVPKGWRVGNIYEEALYINGAAFRDSDFSKSPAALPVIKIAELKSGVTDSTKFTEQNKGDKYYIDSGDLLFSWSGNPDTSIDVFVWQAGKAVLNQHIFRVVPADGTPKSYLYYKLKSMMPIFTELARNKQTTGLGHVTVQNLRDQKVAIPDARMLAGSGAVLSHYFDRSLHLQREIQSLSKIRDTLLPKLISGELRVKDLSLGHKS